MLRRSAGLPLTLNIPPCPPKNKEKSPQARSATVTEAAQEFKSTVIGGSTTNFCGRSEGVQGVLTLFCSGAAQVCHHLRVVELREQLEVEEEDGDRQEEEVEVESGEANQRGCTMNMTVDD